MLMPGPLVGGWSPVPSSRGRVWPGLEGSPEQGHALGHANEPVARPPRSGQGAFSVVSDAQVHLVAATGH